MYVIWLKILITIIIVIVPAWLGTRVGIWYKKRIFPGLDLSPVGSVVAAALGLFAFMLAFTFQLTASRFDTRKELVMNQVVAMRTTWLRAGLLKDSNRIAVRNIMKEYVDLHATLATGPVSVEAFSRRAGQLHDSLWMQAEALAREDRSSEVYALFTSSVNELIDLYKRRAVISLHYRIPEIILTILYFISFFSMFILGFQFGITGKGNLPIALVLAINFAAVMWLIFALDDPTLRILTVNHQQVFELQREIGSGQ